MSASIDKDRADARTLFLTAAAAMTVGGLTGAWLHWTGANGQTSLMMMLYGPVIGATIAVIIAWPLLAHLRRKLAPSRLAYSDQGNYLGLYAMLMGFAGSFVLDSFGPGFALLAACAGVYGVLHSEYRSARGPRSR